MKFYRGKYTTDGFKIGASIRVISWQFKSSVRQNKQGGFVEYAGKISTTESIQPGANIIVDNKGLLSAYTIATPASGMSGMNQYYLTEAALI